MGCCTDKPLKEKVIEHKENILQFNKLTAHEIQAAFKSSEDLFSLSHSEILEILRNLKIIYSENDERVVLKPFLSIFQKESIKVVSDEEYDHRMLKAIMIVMCKSSESIKAKALFETFDVGNNNSLGLTELDFMLRSILTIGEEITVILSGENQEKNDVLEKIKMEIFDKILRKTETLCFEGESTENLTKEKFELKLLAAQNKLYYNFLSTFGLRKTLQEWFRFQESVKKTEPISLKH